MDLAVQKLLLLMAFPLVAFLALIIWMAIILRRENSLSVALKFVGLSLTVNALPHGNCDHPISHSDRKENPSGLSS